MSSWVRVGTMEQLPPGGRLVVDLTYETVALFNVEGVIYCIADICTHDGGPLADGDVEGHAIACPRHGARFDLCSGKALTLPATVPVPSFAVRIEDEVIYVEEPDEAW